MPIVQRSLNEAVAFSQDALPGLCPSAEGLDAVRTVPQLQQLLRDRLCARYPEMLTAQPVAVPWDRYEQMRFLGVADHIVARHQRNCERFKLKQVDSGVNSVYNIVNDIAWQDKRDA